MKSVLRLAASIALFLSAASANAHGGEKHGEEERSAAPAAVSHVQPHHDMKAKSGTAALGKATEGHDVEQVQSEGIAGILKGLHPATVHFPIALFLMAALTELFVLSRPTPDRVAAVRIMIHGGAAGGIVAALFGWIHTGLWFGGDTLMQLHRWNGMLIAVLGLSAAWVAHRQRDARLILRLLLFPIAALLVVQGFMGGELAHVLNHLKL